MTGDVIPINGHDRGPDAANATGTTETPSDSESTRRQAPARVVEADAAPGAAQPAPAAGQRAEQAARFRDVFRPPDLWSEDRPAPEKVWKMALFGAWTDQTPGFDWIRAAGVAYGVFATALSLVLYGAQWVIQHPTRLGGALLIVVLAYLAHLI